MANSLVFDQANVVGTRYVARMEFHVTLVGLVARAPGIAS